MQQIKGGIIAAGEGSRFRQSGTATPKAMIKVAGKPLLGWALSQFCEAAINDLIIIFNKSNGNICSHYVKANFSQLHTDIMCKNTKSSFQSFCEVLQKASNSYLLVTTVDSIYPPAQLRNFLTQVQKLPEGTMALGLSDFIDDEKPLYVELDNENRITSLGGKQSKYVTCGVYYLHGSLCELGIGENFSALRQFLGKIVASGIPSYGFVMGKSIDVDRPQDLEQAQRWVKLF